MAFLRGFGSWLPPRRMTNEELAPQVNATPEWILEVSGIEERRYAADTDTITGIGVLAAQDCLDRAGARLPTSAWFWQPADRASAFALGLRARLPSRSAWAQRLPSTFPFRRRGL